VGARCVPPEGGAQRRPRSRLGRDGRSLHPGAVAPPIALPAGSSETWNLRDYGGRAVVVVFYPADWEPVSIDQLQQYNDVLPQVRSLNAVLVGTSVDSVWCHEAFTRAAGLRVRLLSGAQPRGAVARAYG
jgi:peroxiredoxin